MERFLSMSFSSLTGFFCYSGFSLMLRGMRQARAQNQLQEQSH